MASPAVAQGIQRPPEPAAVVGGPSVISEEELIAAFRKFDADGSGTLDEQELTAFFAPDPAGQQQGPRATARVEHPRAWPDRGEVGGQQR